MDLKRALILGLLLIAFDWASPAHALTPTQSAEAAVKAKLDAAAKARADALAKTRAEAEAKARTEAAARAKVERDAKLKALMEAKIRSDATRRAVGGSIQAGQSKHVTISERPPTPPLKTLFQGPAEPTGKGAARTQSAEHEHHR